MIDLDLDFASLVDYVPYVEKQATPEPASQHAAWLRRRARGFGASEIAIVMVALGMRSADILASYQLAEAKPIRVRLNKRERARAIPRIFLSKAGMRRPRKQGEAANAGTTLEPDLIKLWRAMVVTGQAPGTEHIDPDTIRYVPDLGLPEIWPLSDAIEPRLTCTPDVLARDRTGRLGCVDAKCSWRPYADTKHQGVPEHIRCQVNAQMAVCSGEWGGVLEGEGWSNRQTWNVQTWPVERDDALIEELRFAARAGWIRVEEILAG